jgi:hypothetical protein
MNTPGSVAASKALVDEMSRRTALRRVGGGGLAVGLSMLVGRDIAAVAQEATPTGEGLAATGLFRMVSDPLADKAEEAGVVIDVDTMAISALGKDLVIAAPAVKSKAGFTRPGPMAFSYFSLSSIRCAGIENGYYTMELAQGKDLAPLDQLYPGASEVMVRIVNQDGKAVADRPFTRDVMRVKVEKEPESQTPPMVMVQFQESQSQMGTIENIGFHYVECHYRSGWEWWEWIYGGT